MGFFRKKQLSREAVARIIDNFVDDRGGEWDWDDFISVPLVDPDLERIRVRCNGLTTEFPPTKPGQYCSEQGFSVLRDLSRRLRAPVA